MRVAVVGAGWAGCAAAIELSDRGAQVLLLEASRQPGGRARRVDVQHRGQSLALDNGQHILIGAYQETLGLMQRLGVAPDHALRRLPLRLCFADGSGLRLPSGPAALSLAWGLWAARGWSWRDKLALMRWALEQQRRGFECASELSVQQLCQSLPRAIVDDLLAPLCVSALNTPIDRASGRIFLRVLREALLGQRGSSDLLLPVRDLGALLPQAAVGHLRDRGQTVRLGARVWALRPAGGSTWALEVQQDGRAVIETVDAVLLACPSTEAARLLTPVPQASDWRQQALALTHEAITTVYAFAAGVRLSQPLLALRASAQAPAQFVFDRGQLGGPEGLLAFVISASRGERMALESGVRAQAERELALDKLEVLQTVIERRATFACTPALLRPGIEVMAGCNHLLACGDYVEGPYPATLEGAVRSGLQAARSLR